MQRSSRFTEMGTMGSDTVRALPGEPWCPFSVPDDELTALVRDGTLTIAQEAEYSWRVTVASWRDNARACERHHPGCALEADGPCSIEPRSVGQGARAPRSGPR
jgi:hypothetical protein